MKAHLKRWTATLLGMALMVVMEGGGRGPFAPLTAQERARSAAGLEAARLGLPVFGIMFAPMYVAQKRGYYREEGLETQILLVAGQISVQALSAGSIDFNGAAGATVASILRDVKVKIVMAANNKPLFDLMVQPQIKSFNDLKGKVISVSAGGLGYTVLRDILLHHGLDPERDVRLVLTGATTASRYAALKGRSADGAVLTLPHNIQAQMEGFHKLAFAGDYQVGITGGVAVTDRLLQERPDKILRFLKATYKGNRLYLERREAAMPLVMEFLGLKDRPLVERVYDYYNTTISPQGLLTAEQMGAIIRDASSAIGLKREVRPGDMFSFSLMERAVREVRESAWRP